MIPPILYLPPKGLARIHIVVERFLKKKNCIEITGPSMLRESGNGQCSAFVELLETAGNGLVSILFVFSTEGLPVSSLFLTFVNDANARRAVITLACTGERGGEQSAVQRRKTFSDPPSWLPQLYPPLFSRSQRLHFTGGNQSHRPRVHRNKLEGQF